MKRQHRLRHHADRSKVFGSSDDDTITVTGATTSSTIHGGKQRDQITVAALSSGELRGEKGNDTITVTGALSSSLILGGSEDDQIVVSSATVESSTVHGGKGADNIDISSGAIFVKGEKGNDDIDITGNAAYTINVQRQRRH